MLPIGMTLDCLRQRVIITLPFLFLRLLADDHNESRYHRFNINPSWAGSQFSGFCMLKSMRPHNEQ